jgi:hypothetical protein
MRVYGVPLVPPEWPLQMGEIVYQLRSALDHLAWQLVLLDDGEPGENTQFPIRDKPIRAVDKPEPVSLIPRIRNPEIVRLLNECPPYVGPNGEHRTPMEAHADPLCCLRVLNNVDKHRLLLVTVCVLDLENRWWGMPEGLRSPDLIEINAIPLKDGSPIAWFNFHGAEPPPNFDPHPALQIVVQEPGAASVRWDPIDRLVDLLAWWVEHHVLVRRFPPLLP